METPTIIRPLSNIDTAPTPGDPYSAEDWEERRSKFRHDWLKNIFLNQLDSFLNLLGEPNPNEQYLWEFIDEDLRAWPRKSAEARVLIDSYRDLLSPQALIDREPLRRLDEESREWLGEVTDALWEARTNPDTAIDEAREALKWIDEIYTCLAGALEDGDAGSAEDLKQLRPVFEELRQACSELSDAFGNFERSIQVT